MTNPISATARTAARAAAEQLGAEYGPGLAAEVEAALHAQGTVQRPDQYLDPVAVGSLIVAAATLAWDIYSKRRKRTAEPSSDNAIGHDVTCQVLTGLPRQEQCQRIGNRPHYQDRCHRGNPG